MTAATARRQDVSGVAVFAPDTVEKERFDWQEGQRRKIEAAEALPLRWPATPKERFDLFDAWHHVAMKILYRERGSLRLMAVAKIIIRWSQGIITDSNAELADRAGGCSEKTISREVQDYANLGIMIADMGWRRVGSQIVRTRSLRLALPTILPEGIELPENCQFDLDNSGPDGRGADLDNSGPGDLDNSGPITIDHKKGGSDAA